MRERWPGARLADVVHLAGDFSARRYLRARLEGGGAPTTVVVMVLAGSGLPLSSEELGVFPEPLLELPFLDVHRLLTAIGAPVPEIYVAAVDQGLLVIEDAGDTVLWDAASAAPGAAETLYRRALDALLILHERGTAHRPATSIAFQQRLDERLLKWELEHFLEWGVERRLGITLPAAARRGYEESFDAIARELAAGGHRPQPSRLSQLEHSLARRPPGDHRLPGRVSGSGRVRRRLAVDRSHHPAPDRPGDGGAAARLLLERRAGARGAVDRRRYALVALHRALKVVGRLHYIALAKGKPAPLAFLPDVVATARRFFAELTIPGRARERVRGGVVDRRQRPATPRGAEMRAMVLAAGLGTRLRPLTDDRPKALVDVGGRPLITYNLELLRRFGITDVVINLHYHGEALRSALGDGAAFGLRIEYSPEDPLLDTGGGDQERRGAPRPATTSWCSTATPSSTCRSTA